MRLLVRASPNPVEESLHGYLGRLTGYNGYKKMAWLLGPAGVPRSFVTRPCDLSGIARILDGITDADSLAAMAFWPNGASQKHLRFGPTAVSPRNLSLQRSKFCPICWTEGRVTPRVWGLVGYIACPQHGCLLRDQCPSCGDLVPLFHPYQLRCRCGGSLMERPAEQASPATIALARLLDNLVLGASLPASAAPAKDVESALHLIRFFGVPDASRNWRSDYISKPPVREMVGCIEQAASVLLDWPNGLFAFIDAQRRRPTEGISLAAEFGPFLSRLRGALDDPRFEEIIGAVRQHIAGPAHRIITKPVSFFHTAPEQPEVLSGSAAGKLLGLTTAMVARLIASGELRGEIPRMGRRRAYFVEVRSVDDFIRRRARALTAGDVAEGFGISEFQIERLRQNGFIASVTGIGNSPQEHRYLPETIAAFVEQLKARAIEGSDFVNSFSLSFVARMRSVSLSAIIKQILAGLIPVYCGPHFTEPQLDCFWIRRDDLSKVRIDPSGCPRMSVRRAAKTLGVAVRMVPLLVKSGCLDGSSSAKSLSRHGVSLHSVEQFPKLYATSGRLEHRTGNSTPRVFGWRDL